MSDNLNNIKTFFKLDKFNIDFAHNINHIIIIIYLIIMGSV